MRKSDITPKVIELAKKLKELGFSQEVEDGDWVYLDYYEKSVTMLVHGCWQVHLTHETSKAREKECYVLLPSLYTCLEWLDKEKDEPELWKSRRHPVWYCRWKGDKFRSGDTPLEAVLSACVAVMEEQCK